MRLLYYLKTLNKPFKWWGILPHIKDDTLSWLLTNYKLQDSVECFFVEVNIQEKILLNFCSNNPYEKKLSHDCHYLRKSLDKFLKMFLYKSMLKVNESRYKQCGVTRRISIRQNLLKKIFGKDKCWYNQLRKAF